MLSSEIAERVDRVLAMHQQGVFTAVSEEFATHIGSLITSDNVEAVLKRVPRDLHGAIKQGLALDNRRAADNECLRPEDSPIVWMGNTGRYFRIVAEALLEPDVTKRGILGVVCLPSFQVEWALRLLGSEKKGYTLALSVAETSIWPRHETSPVPVKRLEAEVSAQLVSGVCEAWRKMLFRTRYPVCRRVGMDGVMYHFACQGGDMGYMAGQIWSPGPQTAPGRLVALSNLLYRYAEEKEANGDRLADEIHEAAEWFRRLA